MKKCAAFLARSVTFSPLLFKDMVKCLLLRNRKWVAGRMRIGERETIVIKPHYRLPYRKGFKHHWEISTTH
jgi:hypothetical protein